eukprot:15441012-Alexandrium_andersonii.AAC.1
MPVGAPGALLEGRESGAPSGRLTTNIIILASTWRGELAFCSEALAAPTPDLGGTRRSRTC